VYLSQLHSQRCRTCEIEQASLNDWNNRRMKQEMCINVRQHPWKWPTGVWKRWEDNIIVRVGKRIVSGAFLMIEFGTTHLESSGNYVPCSVKLKMVHFACRGYLCVLYDWHSLHFSWNKSLVWNCVFCCHCICSILCPVEHRHFWSCVLPESIILLRNKCQSLPCIWHHHIPNMRFSSFSVTYVLFHICWGSGTSCNRALAW